MRIVMIGAGNLATHLSAALQQAGHELLQVFSRTEASARELASRLGCPWTTDLRAVTTDGDLYVFSVQDKALAQLAETLCPRLSGKTVVHTAGSMPMSLFASVAEHYGVLYPMQTFSKQRAVDFREIPCFLEASDETTMAQLEALAQSVSHRTYRMDSARRRYLHLSAVWACNFVNHCYAVASDLLAEHAIPFDVLLPLIDETARKVHELSPRQAQTGPAVRADANVMQAHQALMSTHPEWQELYGKLSESINQFNSI